MYPVARVMIRRHFVDRSLETDGAYRKRDLRVFRVVGGPAPRALHRLKSELQAGGRCCIGVTTEGAGHSTDAAVRVLRAVTEFCHEQGLPLFLCGVDEPTLARILPDDSALKSNLNVFRSVQDLLASFCEPGFRGPAGGTRRR